MAVTAELISPNSSLFSEVKKLRAEYIGNNPAGEIEIANYERLRDLCSHHMAFFEGGELLGALRMTPLGHGITFVERMIDVEAYFPRPLETFDANRLVLRSSHRGGGRVRECLFQTAKWMLENTSYNSISAVCRRNLTQLYVGIGGQVVAEGILWRTQDSERDYDLVSLELETICSTIKGTTDYGNVFQRVG